MRKNYVILLFSLITSICFCQVPSNDLIENATVLSDFPFLDEQVNLLDATSGGSLFCLYNNRKIFYKYQPTEDIVLASAILDSDDNDYEIAFFVSSVPNATNHTQLSNLPGLGCSDYGNYYAQFALTAGNTYYVVVKQGDLPINDLVDISFNVGYDYTINFPDNSLAFALSNYNISTSNPGVQIVEAMLETNTIDIAYSNIQDLTGLEYFINATGINMANNSISAIDLSLFPKLKLLRAENNELSSLNIDVVPLLEELVISDNLISNIDLTQNIQIKRFVARNNQITEIDFGSNPLERIDVSSNEISNIDVSNKINLNYLFANDTNISELDLTQNNSLIQLSINDTNVNELDLTQNTSLTYLSISNNQITELDLSQNVLLDYIVANQSSISDLDVTNNTQLLELRIGMNNLTSFDLTQNNLIEKLSISSSIQTLDLTANTELTQLNLTNSLLADLDLSNNSNLELVYITNSYFLRHLNLKNGSNNLLYNPNCNSCPNLEVVCVDDIVYAENNFTQLTNSNPVFVDDCSILTSRNTIEGTIAFDSDDDGCDPDDIKLVSKRVNSSTDDYFITVFSNEDGYYKSLVADGVYSTQLEVPDFFDYLPNDEMTEFLDFNNIETLDFCVTDNSIINDLNVVIIPVSEARPGFDASYKIVYENVGSTTLSGNLNFQFDDTMQTFLNSTPSEDASTSNLLTFNFANILPFEIREIDIEMNTFTPPTVNGDDILNFTAMVTTPEVDNQPDDNQFQLAQIVVNSFDPNDKTVLEGNEITVDQVDDYLHYVVRFQNTGTASAINVIILDELFYFLDVSTFQPITASHNYTTRIVNGNKVEFNFENILLPAQQDDDAGSNGFVAFKIKPHAQFISVGDVILGDASIYFDFNAPIITNQVSTEVVDALSLEETISESNNVKLYPNPTTGIVSIKTNNSLNIISIAIYSLKGELLMTVEGSNSYLDIRNFASGMYILEIETNKGVINKRIIKN
ncbi:T9SS type A sorting domain-containing protein [Psychroserpens sp. AS72]|uniref:DUF7619 domain-containing protein n=1 Tax=Psychroserpens sp. AS72 TaxID=3135775 RepID=UPI0031701CB6